MSHLSRDLAFGGRLLRKHPGFAALAVLVLGLGIGLSTTLFSLVYGIFLKGMPFPESERLTDLSVSNPTLVWFNGMSVTNWDYADWEERQTSFEGIAAFTGMNSFNLVGENLTETVFGRRTSWDFFNVLGVQPMEGRTFNEADGEEGAARVAVISYNFWQEKFNGDASWSETTFTLNGESTTIIGVMGPEFGFPSAESSLWTQKDMSASPHFRVRWGDNRVIARLNDGVSMEQAQEELWAISRQLGEEHPSSNLNIQGDVRPMPDAHISGNLEQNSLLLFGATILILLIACANVANLKLARTLLRNKELAIRSAVGASRGRLVRQVLSESLLISGLGALVGIVISVGGMKFLEYGSGTLNTPFWFQVSLNWWVLGFVILIATFTGLISGLWPALNASRAHVNTILKDSSRGASGTASGHIARGLVVLQIALSSVLLVGAGLVLHTQLELAATPYQFDKENVMTMRIRLDPSDYPESNDRLQLWRELQRRVAARPEVDSASLATSLPGQGGGYRYFLAEGEAFVSEDQLNWCRTKVVDPNYFDMTRIPLIAGSNFDPAYGPDDPIQIVVNQTLAEQLREEDNREVVGRSLRFHSGQEGDEPGDPMLIVGICGPTLMQGIDDGQNGAGFYMNLMQSPATIASLLVRGQGTITGVLEATREEITGLNANQPIYWVRSLEESLFESNFYYRYTATVFAVFAAVALVMACIGLYGVMTNAVTARAREIAIRMALGATLANVSRLILKSGAWQIVIGIAVGLVAAWFLAGQMTALLYQTTPQNPYVFASVATALAITALAACIGPIIRARKISPTMALAEE